MTEIFDFIIIAIGLIGASLFIYGMVDSIFRMGFKEWHDNYGYWNWPKESRRKFEFGFVLWIVFIILKSITAV